MMQNFHLIICTKSSFLSRRGKMHRFYGQNYFYLIYQLNFYFYDRIFKKNVQCKDKETSEMDINLEKRTNENCNKFQMKKQRSQEVIELMTIISRYRNNLQINIKKVFEIMDSYKVQMTMTPQASKIGGFYTTREQNNNFSKKRIGCYSYYLNNCIGSGYSSQVFKGFKNDNKQSTYAIKVIKLSKMSKGNYQLLQNEINILKQLDHPNIIKMHEVFYTQNNCYIITDFCEGGTLQNWIDKDCQLDWRPIFQQVIEGCKYLQTKLIIHRDIKPANIFLKGRQWKIGDFGFARYVPYKTAQIKEIYMIGSPLYMPSQTLQKNIYSLKTDSFALGVLFFHLVTRQFPWSGNNKKELLQNYTSKKYPLDKIRSIPDYYQKFLKGLCEQQISRRYYISDFQELKSLTSGISLMTQATIEYEQDLIQQLSQEITLDIVERMKICKFIHYIDLNIQNLPEMIKISSNLRRTLKFLAYVFQWFDNDSYKKYLDQFSCRNYKQFSKVSQLITFTSQLKSSINSLQGSSVRRCQILRVKLIQLQNVIQNLIEKDFESLKQSIGKFVLHSDFSKVLISPSQINQVQKYKRSPF